MISTLGSSSIHRGVAPLSAKRKVFILRSGSGGLQAISPHSLSPAVLDALQKQGVNVAQLKKAVLVPQSSHSQSSSVTKVLTLPGHVPRTADSGTADSLQSTEASEAAAALMSCMEEETAPVAELSTAHFQSVQTLASPLCENAVVQYQTVTGARFPTPTTMPHDAGFPLSGAVLHSADYQAQQLHDVAGMTLSNLYQDSQALRAVSTGSKTIQVPMTFPLTYYSAEYGDGELRTSVPGVGFLHSLGNFPTAFHENCGGFGITTCLASVVGVSNGMFLVKSCHSSQSSFGVS